jgi:hypothetical protein
LGECCRKSEICLKTGDCASCDPGTTLCGTLASGAGLACCSDYNPANAETPGAFYEKCCSENDPRFGPGPACAQVPYTAGLAPDQVACCEGTELASWRPTAEYFGIPPPFNCCKPTTPGENSLASWFCPAGCSCDLVGEAETCLCHGPRDAFCGCNP